MLAFFLPIFIFFAYNQSLHIFGGDSAEYALVAKTWGIAHAPGYPLYSFLANLVNFIPYSTTPWKVSLLSSLPTIGTAISIYLILKHIFTYNTVNSYVSSFVAFTSSLVYLFLFPVWLYAEVPEVFGLHTFLTLLITYFCLLYKSSRNEKYLAAISLLIGLCISHHQIFILWIPAWLFFLKSNSFRNYIFRKWKKYVMLVGIGTSFYLYAPLVSLKEPFLDWENAKTLNGFLSLIFRSSYGTFTAYAGSKPNFVNQLYDVFSQFVFLIHDFRILGIIFILIGFYVSYKKYKDIFNLFFTAVFIHILFLFYTNFVLSNSFTIAMFERFLIPLYSILIMFFAIGLYWSLHAIILILKKNIVHKYLYILTLSIVLLIPLVFLFLVFYQNYQTIKMVRNFDFFEIHAKNLLDTPPKNAIFSPAGDNSTFPTAYLYFGEKYRKDLVFLYIGSISRPNEQKKFASHYPDLHTSTNIDGVTWLKELFEKNKIREILLQNKLDSYTYAPYGLMWKLYFDNKSLASDIAIVRKTNEKLWNKKYVVSNLSANAKNILHAQVVFDLYPSSYNMYSQFLYANGQKQEAKDVVKDILGRMYPNNQYYQIILLNMYVEDKECELAKREFSKLSKNAIKNSDFAESLDRYMLACDRNSPYLKTIKEKKYELDIRKNDSLKKL